MTLKYGFIFPSIPIWVVGAWPHEKSLARALRYDGLLPVVMDDNRQFMTPDSEHIRAIATYCREHRSQTDPFDIVMEGRTSGDPGERATTQALVSSYADAGATWWLESMWLEPNSADDVVTRIRQGPPHIR